jgi:DNA-binding MarR family transcriptional regulator
MGQVSARRPVARSATKSKRRMRELAERGLVAESVDAADRRGKRLRLTSAGLALEQRLSGHQRDLFARVFRKVGRDKEEAWFEVMSLLAASPVTPSPPPHEGKR